MMRVYNFNRDLAAKVHEDTNHRYDKDGKNHPYIYHLDMVVEVARKFKHLIPEKDYFQVETGLYFHDSIEDVRLTYNDVKKLTKSEIAANIAYALTNEKGKTRAERANDKYYQGIRDTPYAPFGKVCDRIANMLYGKQEGSSMLQAYIKEYPHFKEQVYDEQYKEMFDYIENELMK
jgi:(p)ppGpp synthase/HD superfamily hydrolase